MILVAIAVAVATGAGLLADRHLRRSAQLARMILSLMLYVLVPFVSYVNIAHLRVTVGATVGIGLGWATLAVVGVLAYLGGRRLLRLPDRELGALMCGVVVVNTGYLGLPMVVALLGSSALGHAVAYDQLVSGPVLFTLGFGIGATFGDRSTGGLGARLRAFLFRNPPLVGLVAGLLAPPQLAPAPLPAISHAVVAALLVLGFFAVGVNLSFERRHDAAPLLERPGAPVMLALALRLAAAPLVLAGLSTAIVAVPTAYVVQAAMPTGINSLIVGHAYGLDQRLLATIIVWTTLVAIAVGLVVSLA